MLTPTTPPALAVFPWQAKPVNMDHFLSSLLAVWVLFTTVYCELLQIILLATLALVMGNLFWHSALLAVIVIMSAIGILFTGYRKLHSDTKVTGTCTCKCHGRSPWIKLTGNRLFNIVSVLILGMFKLVESIDKQSTALTITDFISGVVIALIVKFIDCFGEDHPTTADWFFRKDYNQSVFMALNTLWSICAYAFAALLLLPMGIIGMPDPVTYYFEHRTAVSDAYVTAYVTASHSRIVIEALVVSVLAYMMSFRVTLNLRPPILSQWSTIGFKLVEQLRNIVFFWGVLWMTLLTWIRSNPEVEHHFAGIYIRFHIYLTIKSFTRDLLMLSLILSLFFGYALWRQRQFLTPTPISFLSQ